MKKIAGFLLAGFVAFTVAYPIQASYDYYDEPPFEAYKVSEEDMLSYIGKSYNFELDDLYSLNQDLKPRFLQEGSSINLVGNTDNSTSKKDGQRVTLSASDRDLLERLVQAEARGEAYEGKVAVAEVVFNRVDDNDFPDSVYEVITQDRQFEPYATGTINNSPNADSVKAVQEALEGTNLVEGALYFWNSITATSRWLEEKKVVAQIDNHEFLE